MDYESLIRVTIITESLLEGRLADDLKRLGARGYMVSNVHGESWRGVRTVEWAGHHIKLETIVDQDVAKKIQKLLADEYLSRYAMLTYTTNVEVARSDIRPPESAFDTPNPERK